MVWKRIFILSAILISIFYFIRFTKNNRSIYLGLSWSFLYLNRPDALLIIVFTQLYYFLWSFKSKSRILSKTYIYNLLIFFTVFVYTSSGDYLITENSFQTRILLKFQAFLATTYPMVLLTYSTLSQHFL